MLYDRFGNAFYMEADEKKDPNSIANELLKKWNSFKYGIPYKKEIIDIPDEPRDYFDKHYKFLSPEKFEEYGGGVCWDYVEYGDMFLREKGIEPRKFYIWTETPPKWPTHTFLVIPNGDQFIYVESSFEYLKGVKTYNSLDEIFNVILKAIFKVQDISRRFNRFKYVVFEFTGTHPPYGCTSKQYMTWIPDNCKEIKDGIMTKDDGTPVQESVFTRLKKLGMRHVDCKFDKLYFASPTKYENGMDLTRPLFLTPYKGLASIFCLPRDPKTRKEMYGIPDDCKRYNLDYDEWSLPPDQLMHPFNNVHVTVEGVPDLEKKVVEVEGYIHELDVSKLKDHLYIKPWMTNGKEMILCDVKHVDFTDIIHHRVTGHIRGGYLRDEHGNIIQEAKLSTEDKEKMDDDVFGIPELRKYPMPDEKHVIKAVQFFNKAPDEYKEELARNIVKRAKELDMDWENWDTLKPYLKKSEDDTVQESDRFIEVDVIIDDDESVLTRPGFVQESKKTHMKRFLDRNKYDPETGTYETDMVDENGKKIRVPLEISKNPNDSHILCRVDSNGNYTPEKIVIGRKVLKSKNWNSQSILKHEEGHWNDYTGNKLPRDIIPKVNKAIKSVGNSDVSKIHGNPRDEIVADTYSVLKTSLMSKTKQLNRTIKNFEIKSKIFIRKLNRIKNVSVEEMRRVGINNISLQQRFDLTYEEIVSIIRESMAFIKGYYEKKYRPIQDEIKYLEKSISKYEKISNKTESIKELIEFDKRSLVSAKEDLNKLDSMIAKQMTPADIPAFRDEMIKMFNDTCADNIKDHQIRIKLMNKAFNESFEIDDDSDIITEETITSTPHIKITVGDLKKLASIIHDKVVKDSKPPTENQNCLLCTWCMELNLRRIVMDEFKEPVLPRPVYSPRDPLFDHKGHEVIKNPDMNTFKFRSKKDLILKMNEYQSRWYVHVNWKDSSGGHEFLCINIDGEIYLVDAQEGLVLSLDNPKSNDYFDINFDNSYMVRLDLSPFNYDLFEKMNSKSSLVQWDPKKDIPYMKDHGMLSEEDMKSLNEYEVDIIDDNISYYTEWGWQDIRNGVNPYSKKLFFHVTTDKDLDEKVLKPRIPTWVKDLKDPEKIMAETKRWENIKTPRVCFSPSIEGCLNSIMNIHKITNKTFGAEQLYVFIPEKPIDQYQHKTNKEIIRDGDVFDAKVTGEVWITEPVKLKFYGTIQVDQVKDNGKSYPIIGKNGKPDKNEKIGRYTYKWHWLIHPSVQKKMDQYEKENQEEEAKKQSNQTKKEG